MAAVVSDDPDRAFLVALASLTGMGPARLSALTAQRSPREAWADVRGGRALARPEVASACGRHAADVAAVWRRQAGAVDVDGLLRRYDEAGVRILLPADRGFPVALRQDPEPPAVLFAQGDLEVLQGPVVAVVGTRRCTHYGRQVSAWLGRELATGGVRVVSGLASGIDAAAHRGVLQAGGAPPVAVVGTGLDVPYPRGNAGLWREVATLGLVLSESPLGAPAEPWRFPARNRIIAGLADVVVVVESHESGGSLHTVDAAHLRGRPVLAVPGPVTSPASDGTNQLLADGCHPLRRPDDVLVTLGLTSASRATGRSRSGALDPAGAGALDALVGGPALLEQVAARTGLDLAEAATVLARLEGAGLVRTDGAWFERVDR